jgi:hypothetical protein
MSCRLQCNRVGKIQLAVRIVQLLCIAALASACVTNPPPPPPLPDQSQSQNEDPRNPLSHGAVTSTVQKGVTTQAELLELFGGPNIATTDSDSVETWVYEVKSTTSNTNSQGAASARIDAFNAFFFGRAAAQVHGQSSSSTTFSTNNVTFIVKFNPNKTVKDYHVRQATF